MVKQVDLQHMKNAFMNLAVPYMQLTEPGGAPQIKLNETVTVNLWDRWDVKGGNMQLNELFITLEETYKVTIILMIFSFVPSTYSTKAHLFICMISTRRLERRKKGIKSSTRLLLNYLI